MSFAEKQARNWNNSSTVQQKLPVSTTEDVVYVDCDAGHTLKKIND